MRRFGLRKKTKVVMSLGPLQPFFFLFPSVSGCRARERERFAGKAGLAFDGFCGMERGGWRVWVLECVWIWWVAVDIRFLNTAGFVDDGTDCPRLNEASVSLLGVWKS